MNTWGRFQRVWVFTNGREQREKLDLTCPRPGPDPSFVIARMCKSWIIWKDWLCVVVLITRSSGMDFVLCCSKLGPDLSTSSLIKEAALPRCLLQVLWNNTSWSQGSMEELTPPLWWAGQAATKMYCSFVQCLTFWASIATDEGTWWWHTPNKHPHVCDPPTPPQ